MGKILVTGGAGYIGSHVVKALGEKGYDILVYDNLSTGHEWAVLHGDLVVGDIRDRGRLDQVLDKYEVDAVMHFAAHIVVPESVQEPLKYYMNNVGGSLTLLQALQEHGVDKFIFSSSAAVYGIPEEIPVRESAPLQAINPYGETKAMVEKVLEDMAYAGSMNYVALRYFNVAGADPEGRIGEGKEDATHLITMCVRTAAGLRPEMSIFGDDYPTSDGTCVRDYIHVEDLAEAHILALQYLLQNGESQVFNCGYGRGFSVLEVVEAARKATGVDFPVRMAPRREGDPPALVADSSKLQSHLGWRPQHDDLQHIIATAWNWETRGRTRE
ncbi:MAG: UDP-glucose 4-epimerase GalE [Syntrophomonadaceae bacterium]|jgi:UDP-glucose 4-epimerase|nr:UDP-glucose 4-epimerase GalE [Syntrophomonadaceae bacterium]